MPTARDLPDDLVPLGRRQALELSDLRFRSDTDRLIEVIEEELEARASIADEAEREAATRREQERLDAEAEEAERERRAAEEEERVAAQAERERRAAEEAATRREQERLDAEAEEAERERRAAEEESARRERQAVTDAGREEATAKPATARQRASRPSGAGGRFSNLTRNQRRGLAAFGVCVVLAAVAIVVLMIQGGPDTTTVRIVKVGNRTEFKPAHVTVQRGSSIRVVNDAPYLVRVGLVGADWPCNEPCPLQGREDIVITNIGSDSTPSAWIDPPGRGDGPGRGDDLDFTVSD